MPRRSGGLPLLRLLPISQLLVLAALALTICSLLNISVAGLPLIPLAVLLLCIAWLLP